MVGFYLRSPIPYLHEKHVVVYGHKRERETSLQRNVGWLEWYFFSLIKYVIQFQIEQSSWINAEKWKYLK